jgi:hypothetical protein
MVENRSNTLIPPDVDLTKPRHETLAQRAALELLSTNGVPFHVAGWDAAHRGPASWSSTRTRSPARAC